PQAPRTAPAPGVGRQDRDQQRPAARRDQGGPQDRRDRPTGDRNAPATPTGPPRPVQAADLQSFAEIGMRSDITQPEGKPRPPRRKGDPKKKSGKPNTAEWEGKRKRPPAKGEDPVVPGRKRIRPSQIFRVENTMDRRPKPSGKRKGSSQQGYNQQQYPPQEPELKIIKLYGDFTVGAFADKIGKPPAEIIKRLFLMGHPITINQLMEPDLAEELAVEMDIEIEIVRENDEADIEDFLKPPADNDKHLVPRAPVVTIMGHVDHGKTSLLDFIRRSDVASGEFGGITQHIGAYSVTTPKGDVVFLDTPGHAAFTEMRSRGANITDVVLLVVAANDGVMPQTIEAINHAKAASVPIIVAINKTDVEGANPSRVKQELMSHELIAEDFGGDTIMVEVSAKTGEGIDTLLEYVALQTEIMELKANGHRAGLGTVVESHKDPLRGAVATILVEQGTLKIGDIFVCGTEYGRVRAMRDDKGVVLENSGPSTPVEILGLTGSPDAGEKFVVVPTETVARELAEKRVHRRRTRSARVKEHISLENLRDRMSDDEIITLNIILKGDVQGSVQAIVTSLLKIRSDKVAIKILHSGVGSVGRADVQLADASEAIILAFHVGVEPGARELSEDLGVDVRAYNVIYALLEDIEKAMLGLLEPEYDEKEEGRAKVQQTFKVSKIGTVAGCLVEEGAVAISHKARLVRGGSIIWTGKLRSLRRVKDDVKEVLAGVECGIGLENFNDVKVGDHIETYSLVEREITLVNAAPTASAGKDNSN
ncbi:MAG: translation initiation factor IF-2, partial [Candidatus Sumerlaeia bacterium]|nr:translation initiation factor IF-2 [Candidatus Sumerlaeia bacterium]